MSDRQTRVFLVLSEGTKVGYYNLSSKLSNKQFASVEQRLVKWFEDGTVQPQLLCSDKELALCTGNTALAWFWSAEFDHEDIYADHCDDIVKIVSEAYSGTTPDAAVDDLLNSE